MGTITKTVIGAVTALLVTGCSCAKKDDLARVESELRETRQIAEAALSTANTAQASAQSADVVSKRTEEVVNRSYQKSMYK